MVERMMTGAVSLENSSHGEDMIAAFRYGKGHHMEEKIDSPCYFGVKIRTSGWNL